MSNCLLSWRQHFQRRCDADMVAELAARPVGMGNMTLTERISYAVQTRLRMIVPYIGALWHGSYEAMAGHNDHPIISVMPSAAVMVNHARTLHDSF